MSTARHRKIVGTTRKGRIARLTAAAAVAGALAAGLVTVAIPANAETPGGNLPGCVLPAGIHWQRTGTTTTHRPGIQRPIAVALWGASGDGHTYSASVLYSGLAPDLAVHANNAQVVCTVS